MATLLYREAIHQLRNAGCQVQHLDSGGGDALHATHGTWTKTFWRDRLGVFSGTDISVFLDQVRAADKRVMEVTWTC